MERPLMRQCRERVSETKRGYRKDGKIIEN